ncbi:pleckstrin homology-like domain family B member 2 isoform X1 [Brachionus plicatilis]|uniref:Pleckstrin homology-like domain family B member 2 isoform X1 n=1 Tax=Brachionus plicatilis TaxID=10195 RepID=A0A3M7RVY7_BRAPC|nr:pleckstrin homology-like domain family B member 2 isoform X1 [Brachionus plicatilis]
MERALLDVEQTSELKFIQSEENKIKHLHQEHQLKLEAFNIHMNQIRNEIRIVQMTIKNIENEILILDTTLDSNFRLSGLDSSRIEWENIKSQKEHALEEARRAHEDLEFQLMELEAKYETELEDIQTRLINEQEILIESFKQKNCLVGADQEQQKLISKLKSETEILELEKKSLIDQFQKQRSQLESIEKKLQKIGENREKKLNENLELNENGNDSPSPASSSASLSSATNSSETGPSINQNYKSQECDQTSPIAERYFYPQLDQIQNQIYSSAFHQANSNNYHKQFSQSFRDILENTMLINGIGEANNFGRNQTKNSTFSPYSHKAQRLSRCLHAKNSLAGGYVSEVAANVSGLTGSVNHAKIPIDLSHHMLPDQEMDEYIDELEKKLLCPINGQLAMKFAELNRAKADNYCEQYQTREIYLIEQEKNKRDERNLKEETLRYKMSEENIKLRDKKHTQARPLTRYLPVRDNNFDLKLHVENSGHNLINQIDPNTRQPMIFINSNSCRGYLLKMGQKFKTWNKRWFVFDRNKRTLCYYMDKHETKLRGSIYFQSINEVYVDHMRTIKSPDAKSTFVVKTFDRNFYLVAPSSELMRIWIDVIFTGAEGYLEFIE